MVILSLLILLAGASSRAAETFAVDRVADGVFAIVRTEVLKQPLDGNTMVIVGDDGVAVVDATQTYTSARAVIAEIRKLTSMPVKYLINTHWHNDHVLGNRAYVDAWPGVQIAAHEFTRDDMVTETRGVLQQRIQALESRAQYQQLLDSGKNAAGQPLSNADRHRLRERLSMPASHLDELREVVLTPPTLTYRGAMTLWLGAREVRLFSHGPGNTRGDTVVWLPAQRVLASGDLLVSTVPFMSVSFPRGWRARLKEIETLDPVAIVPGHGPVQRERSWLARHLALLDALIAQVDAAIQAGLSLSDTQARVNLDAFKDLYAHGDASLADEFDFRVTSPAVIDAYREGKSGAGFVPNGTSLRYHRP